MNYFDIKDNYSDFYFLYITYPLLDKNFRPGAKWNRKILAFNQKEMVALLGDVKTKSGKQDRFLSFGFNATDKMTYGTRGLSHLVKREFSANILENKLYEIKNMLG